MQTTTVTLEAHNCANRHSYHVTFSGYTWQSCERQALDFIEARKSTHAFHEVNEGDVLAGLMPELYRLLWPICEHGLSEWLCYGPAHYATSEEIANGW